MRLDRYDPFDGMLGISLAVRAGSAIHVSGAVGIAADGTFPSGIEAQMRQAYANIAGILENYGLDLRDVAEQTVFVVGDVPSVMATAISVRQEIFGAELPASAMVGVTQLAGPEALVEIKVTAYR